MIALQNLIATLEAWPGVTHLVQWEHVLCFKVNGKLFACVGLELEGSGYETIAFKVRDETHFDELIEVDGLAQAWHFAKRKWAMVEKDARLPARDVLDLLKTSYQAVVAGMPKKVQLLYQLG